MFDLTPHTRLGAPSPHQTVGIVDADPLYRWFVTEALSARGIDGVEFATLADAARFTEGHPADLLLIDHQTLVDERTSGPGDLAALSLASPCVLLASAEPGGALPQLGVAAVEKPSGLETLMGLVEGRLHGTS